jgi:hypothetical protein
MIDPLIIEAARIEAALAVKHRDGDYTLRQIYRWYSRTFHTPLHQVPDLDPLEVLQAFYEDRLGDMKDEELLDEIQDLIQTHEEKLEALRVEAQTKTEDEVFSQMIETKVQAAEAKEKEEIAAAAPRQQITRPLPEATLEGMSVTGKPLREDLVAPPDIHIKFIDDDLLDLEAEGHGTMTQPEKKR